MANETKQKQEIPQTRGSFQIRGIVTAFDKSQEWEKKTQKGNTMRRLTFDISSAEGHIHRLQLTAYQGEYAYYTKNVTDEKGNSTRVTQQVKWAERKDFMSSNLGEGFSPIDRVNYTFDQKIEDDGSVKNENRSNLTFDAIEDLVQCLSVGQTLMVRGNIQIEQYIDRNGDTRNTTRLVPTTIYRGTKALDFNAEDFQELANYTQRVLIDNVEFNGDKEAVLTGLVIGNQKMGRQDFIFKECPELPEYSFKDDKNTLKSLQKAKKYISMELYGKIINTVEEAVEENKSGFVMRNGIQTRIGGKNPMKQRSAVSFRREFLVSGYTNDEEGDIDFDTYTEENVQQFIDTFIRAEKEFGGSTQPVSEPDGGADEFLF